MISFFKDELLNYQKSENSNEYLSYPPIYPICLILSKLRPFMFKSDQSAKMIPKLESKSNEEYSTITTKTKQRVGISLAEDDYNFFFEYLIASLKNRNYLVRNLVSKSLICVLPNMEISKLLPKIILSISGRPIFHVLYIW